MARSQLLKRLDRLDRSAVGEYIVYEGSDEIPEEEHDRFMREVIGETAPNSIIVFIRRFSFQPYTPLRLVDRRPSRAAGAGLASDRAANKPGHAKSGWLWRPDEHIIPKRNPALSRRLRDVDEIL
jgi:hypothetical protein